MKFYSMLRFINCFYEVGGFRAPVLYFLFVEGCCRSGPAQLPCHVTGPESLKRMLDENDVMIEMLKELQNDRCPVERSAVVEPRRAASNGRDQTNTSAVSASAESLVFNSVSGPKCISRRAWQREWTGSNASRATKLLISKFPTGYCRRFEFGLDC